MREPGTVQRGGVAIWKGQGGGVRVSYVGVVVLSALPADAAFVSRELVFTAVLYRPKRVCYSYELVLREKDPCQVQGEGVRSCHVPSIKFCNSPLAL